MIQLNDIVFILPTASLLFKGRWGRVAEIKGEFLKIKFVNHTITYNFTRNELLTIEDYVSWFKHAKVAKHIKTKKKLNIEGYKLDQPIISDHLFTPYEYYPVTYCNQCGQETTGLFSALCEDCQYPLPYEKYKN